MADQSDIVPGRAIVIHGGRRKVVEVRKETKLHIFVGGQKWSKRTRTLVGADRWSTTNIVYPVTKAAIAAVDAEYRRRLLVNRICAAAEPRNLQNIPTEKIEAALALLESAES